MNNVDRFWTKVDRTGDCWNWTGAVANGYGKFHDPARYKAGLQRNVMAHRYSYETVVGDIPEGYQIDHRCHNRRCVNPDHLRLVTQKQNQENRSGCQRNTSSGVRGVHWHEGTSKWVARVRHNRQVFHCGLFATIEEAQMAVTAKRNELFTHNDDDRVGGARF